MLRLLNLRSTGLSSQMSFVDHIEELRWRLIRSLAAILLAAILVYTNIEWVFDHVILGPVHPEFISYAAMCRLGTFLSLEGLCPGQLNLQFQNTALSGQFMMSFSVSFMLGFILAFPYIFTEFWYFLKPALTEKELKGARGIIFWTTLLFFTGVVFAYFIVVPFTISFFAAYTLSASFQNIITMSNYYDTVIDMMLSMGLVFELPLLVFFLSKTGILTPKLMREKRSYAIVIIMIIAAVITPPDGLSLWMVALPLLLLYEGSIKISARVERQLLKNQV